MSHSCVLVFVCKHEKGTETIYSLQQSPYVISFCILRNPPPPPLRFPILRLCVHANGLPIPPKNPMDREEGGHFIAAVARSVSFVNLKIMSN